MAIMTQRDLMTEIGVYETVKSTPSSMDDPSAHFLEYISYLLSISVDFTLKDILERSFLCLVVVINVKWCTECGEFFHFLVI